MKFQHNKLDVSAIKNDVNLHHFYLRELNLCQFGHQSGKWVTAGLCPFHDDHHAGSFKINLESGAFKCWSCGAHGGDIIAFVIQKHGFSFQDALKSLADVGGLR